MGKFQPTHGMTKTPTYQSWQAMLKRCTNPNHIFYKYYGGIGIKVCERWRKFENFLADMGERPADRSLDRINNDGNYEPGNCRWATRKEQGRNTRANKFITFRGETLCLEEWALRTGLGKYVLSHRLSTGKWSIEKALTTPLMKKLKRIATKNLVGRTDKATAK